MKKIACPKCQAKNPEDNVYCGKCGCELNKKYRKAFWLWFLLLLLFSILAPTADVMMGVYAILVLLFSRFVHKALKTTGAGYGWFLGLFAIFPILGFWLPFFIARSELKQKGNWVPEKAPKGYQPETESFLQSSWGCAIAFIISFIITSIIIYTVIPDDGGGGWGGGTRNCVTRLTGGYLGGAKAPSCSNNDGTLKNTTLNGRSLGKCYGVTAQGVCIR